MIFHTNTNIFSIYLVSGDMTKSSRTRVMPLSIPTQRPDLRNSVDEETSKKYKTIMKLQGIIKINDIEYKTDIRDLDDLGELGNGTSGHVVKMRHKETDTFIAVKVSNYNLLKFLTE